MKKVNQKVKDELRPVYRHEDFPNGFIRGKYAKRFREASNIVVLRPEVADVFPNDEAVNSALLSLIKLAHKTAHIAKHTTKRTKKTYTA